MSSVQQKRAKKTNPSYISSVISVSLILFVLGIIASFFLQSAKLSQSVKESISLQLVLNDNLNESDIFQFSEQLKTNSYVKETEIFNKEDAAKMMIEDLGEDFVQTIGYNPLPNAIILRLNADYSVPDSLLWIKEDLLASGNVQAVNYDELLLSNISQFTSKFLFVLLVFLAILLLISFIIIDSTIKLAMFSKRFIIRSMQLVGATRWFITKPFILRAVFNGLLSAILAAIFLLASVYLIEHYIIELSVFKEALDFLYIFGGLISIGVVISLISTFFAVRKYLRMKLDELY